MSHGFPPPHLTAPYAKRYKGLYYYDAYGRRWDQIVDIRNDRKDCWVVMQVDVLGNGVGPRRVHVTPLWANRFAQFPFEVEWIGGIPARKDRRG